MQFIGRSLKPNYTLTIFMSMSFLLFGRRVTLTVLELSLDAQPAVQCGDPLVSTSPSLDYRWWI